MKKIKIVIAVALALAALLFTSCKGAGEATEITSVKYSSKSGKLEISATLSDTDLGANKGDTIYLIEVPASHSESDILTLIPIAQSKAAGEMDFSVSLSDGARTRLYSGFVLASYSHAGGYKAISEIKHIENPDALAKNKGSYPIYPGIKGLSLLSTSDALTLGVRHTVIRVPIEEYIAEKGEGEIITDVFDGVSHYYNSKKIAELDYKIKNLSDAGIEVFIEFTLGASEKELSPSLSAIAPKGVESAEGRQYAISASGEAYSHIAAFFEFFAERYTRSDAKYGFAASYIIGRGVNSLEDTYSDTPQTLLESASKYERVLRIAETALKSNYAEGKVFVSLNNILNVEEKADETDDKWGEGDSPVPDARRTLFGGAEYLSELFALVERGGGFEVGVALIPTASDSSSAVWKDIGSTDSAKSAYITMKNLSVMRDIIGEDRELMVYNYEISSEDETSMAASYAYAFMRALEADVSAFIYGAQTDKVSGTENGLFYIDPDGDIKVEREIYGVFRDIDRYGASEPAAAVQRIGDEWRTLYKKYGKEAKAFRYVLSDGSTVIDEKDEGREQALLFDFSDGKNHNFFPSDSTAHIVIADTGSGKALSAGLYPKYHGENVGVRTPALDFEVIDGIKTVKVVFSLAMKESNTASVSLVLVSSGEELSVIRSQATVQSGNRQTVYFDVSDAEIEKGANLRAYFWVESAGGRSAFYDDASLAADDVLYIENISLIYKPKMPIWLIVIIILVPLLAAGFFLYRYILIRRERARRRREMERRRTAAAGRNAAKRGAAGRDGAPRTGAAGRDGAPRGNIGGASMGARPRTVAPGGAMQRIGADGRRAQGRSEDGRRAQGRPASGATAGARPSQSHAPQARPTERKERFGGAKIPPQSIIDQINKEREEG